MVLSLVCVRHGESLANAGFPTMDPLSIGLTDFGLAQARALAATWPGPPDRLVCSPARRAQQTAEPTLHRFADLAIETWPIQEFSYLSPGRCAGTSVFERKAWVQAYWDRGDPHFRDGEDGAESFAELIDRVDDCLARLAAPQPQRVLIFGHGQFINALRWRVDERAARLDIRGFRDFDLEHPIHNCQAVSLAW